jgi:hypothetical protein
MENSKCPTKVLSPYSLTCNRDLIIATLSPVMEARNNDYANATSMKRQFPKILENNNYYFKPKFIRIRDSLKL